MSEAVTIPEKSQDQNLAEKKAAYQAELTGLKLRVEEATAAQATAQAAYDNALAVTSRLGRDRLDLEKRIRDEAKERIAAFDADVRKLKDRKLKASVDLEAANRTLLDVVSAWERVKGDWVDSSPPEVVVAQTPPPSTPVTPETTVVGGSEAATGTIEDGPGAAFGVDTTLGGGTDGDEDDDDAGAQGDGAVTPPPARAATKEAAPAKPPAPAPKHGERSNRQNRRH